MSVSELTALLPNLKTSDVLLCEFVLYDKSPRVVIVPSPSDTHLELVGHFAVSDESFERIRNQFVWESALREKIPAPLSNVIPTGELLVSREFNNSFDQNRTFRHGYVVAPASGEGRVFYFIASDPEHSLQ